MESGDMGGVKHLGELAPRAHHGRRPWSTQIGRHRAALGTCRITIAQGGEVHSSTTRIDDDHITDAQGNQLD